MVAGAEALDQVPFSERIVEESSHVRLNPKSVGFIPDLSGLR
jgi:hypothetical protein